MLACAIRLDSPGSAFYRHKRIGRDGREIGIYKFRTMVITADAVLKACLEKDDALRKEWESSHKINTDPRVTRVGAFLRKTSLDELPQFINVLAGSMSLVGPRPIVAAEIKKYGPVYEEYCRVRPGITGLWQISGRNDTSYGDRVAYDHYYICNWSVWMDLWILAKTVPVALSGYGAY
jgi:lipopolysaccharide/colanic/teichoic acid biosynthesis glycosyltransferase